MKAATTIHHNRPPAYGVFVLWLPTMLLFFLLFADMMAARYILIVLPPLFLVVFDDIRRGPAVAVVAITMLLSVALAIADYRLVNIYPRWVQQYAVPLQNQGFRVWNAAESGLRFYLEEEGIQTLDQYDIRPKPQTCW